MGVPNAVKKQADMARKAHAAKLTSEAMASPPQGRIPPVIQNNDQDFTPPVQAPLVQPPVEVNPPEKLASTDAATLVTEDPLTDWETRYKNMRKAGDRRAQEATDKLAVANNRISELEAQLAGDYSGGDTDSSVMSADEREFMGEDAAAVIDRMNKEHKEALDNLRLELAPKGEQGGQADASQDFFATLDKYAPEWKKVNANKYFHSWLAQINSQTGFPRQDDLDLAQGAQDGMTVARIVNAFIASDTSRVAGMQTDLPGQRVGAESTIVNPASIPEGYHMEYTGQDVKDFYTRKTHVMNRFRAGKAQQSDLDALAIEEKEIRKAVSEGRVV